MKRCTSLLSGVALAFALTSSAGAAQIACPDSLLAKVDGATACEYSDSVDQDNTNPPLVVNTEKFFGFQDWQFLKKDDGPDIDQDGKADGLGQDGTFDFGGSFYQMMLVFKDGQDTTLVGFITTMVSGDWSTPFVNPPFDVKNAKDTSHISYYYRRCTNGDCDGQDVPEPGTLVMLGAGLAGLALIRRRRRS